MTYDGHMIDSLIALVDKYIPAPACTHCGDVATKIYFDEPVCDYCHKQCREVDAITWAEFWGEQR